MMKSIEPSASAQPHREARQLANPHPSRARILRARIPNIAEFEARNPFTAVILGLAVALQLGLAAFAQNLSWPLFVVLAYFVGAFVSHALLILIHEGTHDHVFRKKQNNILFSIFGNLPLILPVAVGVRIYHLHHHSQLGNVLYDGDIASEPEVRWVGRSSLRKALWLATMPLLMSRRPSQLASITRNKPWHVFNLVVQLLANVSVYFLLGGQALLFLALSLYFATTLHPLGARWLQDHYTLREGQGTNSYYGSINLVAFNIGYHNEHHDFPRVPWNRLPAVRRAGIEFYDSIESHRSWTWLLLRFLFNPALGLDSRQVYAVGKGSAAQSRKTPVSRRAA